MKEKKIWEKKILGKSVPEIILEIIIVVLGILIAFFLDNWWSGVENKKEHDLIIQALHREFSANDEIIEKELAWIKRGQQNILTLLTLPPDKMADYPGTKLDSLLYYGLGVPDFQPQITVVEDLINSGKLKYLESNDLEEALASWWSGLEETKMLTAESSRRNEEIIIHYLYDKISFLSLDKTFEGPTSPLQQAVDFGHDYGVFKERKFRNYVDDQFFHFGQYENQLKELDKDIDQILQLTSDE